MPTFEIPTAADRRKQASQHYLGALAIADAALLMLREADGKDAEDVICSVIALLHIQRDEITRLHDEFEFLESECSLKAEAAAPAQRR